MHLIYRRARRRESFDPRSLPLALSRTVLAVSQMVGIVLTPMGDLFAPRLDKLGSARCTGLHQISMWCAVGTSNKGLLIGETVSVIVLLAVAVGYRPRWTCVPHWYVTVSFGMSVTQPWGGDAAASIATLLLIPILLGDDRSWQWTRPTTGMALRWQGAAYAAWWLIRIQVAVIYIDAAVSKLTVSQWRNGTAMYAVFDDPSTGMPQALRGLAAPLLHQDVVMRALTIAVPLMELAIACCALGGRALRKRAVLLGLLLHGGIAVMMGLVEFAAVMISVVLLCAIEGDPPCDIEPLSRRFLLGGSRECVNNRDGDRVELSNLSMGSIDGGS